MSEQKPIFWVNNRHSKNMGEPPRIDGNTAKRYHGYFENAYGDQFIFIYDHQTKMGVIWAGDAGWEQSYPVVDGLVPALMMSDAEETWLQACWNTATTFEQNKGE